MPFCGMNQEPNAFSLQASAAMFFATSPVNAIANDNKHFAVFDVVGMP